MTKKFDVPNTKMNEAFKKTQPLPQWRGARASGNYAAPVCQPAVSRPPQVPWPEASAAGPSPATTGPSSARWIGLDSARYAAKESFVLGVLALAGMVSVVEAFGHAGAWTPALMQAGAWAGRLAS